jgi:hypothetical protein
MFILVLSFIPVPPAAARPQRVTGWNGVMQIGTSVERTMGPGEVHRFAIPLRQGDFAEVVVDQHGIDVIVRVIAPGGATVGEFDSPNGAQGPENVGVAAVTAGTYSIEVLPFNQVSGVSPGRYEIRLVTVRPATSAELQSGNRQDMLKNRSLALLHAVIQTAGEVRSAQTRVHAEMDTARLLPTIDDKLVRELIADAMAAVRDYVAKMPDPERENEYSVATQMRGEVLQFLGQFDPELALAFIGSTRIPDGVRFAFPGQGDPEVALEANLASQIANKNPSRAVQIAAGTLDKGYSSGLAGVISVVRSTDPASAAILAKGAAAKLQADKLLETPEAANLTVNLLNEAQRPSAQGGGSGGTAAPAQLLSDQEYRNLFTKAVGEVLAFSPTPGSPYSQEMNSARNLLAALKSMSGQMQRLAPDSMSSVEEKLATLTALSNPNGRFFEAINNSPVDDALESIKLAPADVRGSLYEQLAQRVARNGDLARARQILTDGIPNAGQRQNALGNLERQGIYDALNKGKFEEALQAIDSIRSPRERASMIEAVAGQVERRQKRDAALAFLGRARLLLNPGSQAASQGELNALMQIALAYARLDSTRGFEIVEPLVDQLNDLSSAAVTLNGFNQQYFENGELLMQNGNPVGYAANQITQALGQLGPVDFDRAVQDVTRIRLPEVRLAGFIAIAQQTLNPPPSRH